MDLKSCLAQSSNTSASNHLPINPSMEQVLDLQGALGCHIPKMCPTSCATSWKTKISTYLTRWKIIFDWPQDWSFLRSTQVVSKNCFELLHVNSSCHQASSHPNKHIKSDQLFHMEIVIFLEKKIGDFFVSNGLKDQKNNVTTIWNYLYFVQLF